MSAWDGVSIARLNLYQKEADYEYEHVVWAGARGEHVVEIVVSARKTPVE